MGLPADSSVHWGVEGLASSGGLVNISECVLGISSHPHHSRCELDWLGEDDMVTG